MFAAIFIPNFSLQAVLRHEPELIARAVALTDSELPKLGIIQLTARARSAGVWEGMTASQAMARCSDLVIKSRSPAQELAATEVLIQTAYAFSPFIESTNPGVCTMDLRGLRIVEDETSAREWAEEICKALAQFHLHSRIGFAATPELALLAANYHSGSSAFLVSKPAEFVSGLPIEILGLPSETLETLNHWGIGTAGALLALGKDQLAQRLGPAAIEVFDRLSGNSIRPLKLAALPETFAEQMEFENEIETLELLLFVLRRFTEQLSRRIGLLYLVVAELHLKLGLASGATYESVFKVPSPTGNAEILFRMLHTHLENVRTDAPISSLWLAAKPGRPETHQFGLFETTLRDPNQFAETLARLEALCGPNRVGTPILEPTLRPDSFRMKPPKFCAEWKKTRKRKIGAGAIPGSCSAHFRRHGLQLRRFRPPVAAQVEFRERFPALIRSAVCHGAIVDRRGPFSSSGNWWDDGRWSREEWDVQTADGAMYRIFRTWERQRLAGEFVASFSSIRRRDASAPGELQECFVEGVYD